MYPNLERVMKERGITKKDLAIFLDLSYGIIFDKTNGHSRFFLDEALFIRDKFFPDLEIKYLFATSEVA